MVRIDSSYLVAHIQVSGIQSQSDPKVILASKYLTRESSKRERKKSILTKSDSQEDSTRLLRHHENDIKYNEVDDDVSRTDERRRKEDANDATSKTKEKKTVRRLNETLRANEKEIILKKTHFHLQRKQITHLDDMRHCKNLRVLFLQENYLKRVGHLRHLHTLQELYLSDNQIVRIEGLNNLHCLKKLLVSRNRIGVVECLPPNLVELEVGGQLLPAGDTLLLDPQALMQVQSTLKLLDISDNKLTEIGAVGLLSSLQILRASNNELKNLVHLTSVFGTLSRIVEIDLRGNPVSLERLYRPEIILKSSDTLRLLDEKKVTEETRAFMVNSDKYKKSTKKSMTEVAQVRGPIFTNEHFLFDQRKGHQSEAPFNVDLQNETSKFVLGSFRKTEFEALLNNRCHLIPSGTHDDITNPVTRMCLDGDSVYEEATAAPCRESRTIPKLFLRHKQKTS